MSKEMTGIVKKPIFIQPLSITQPKPTADKVESKEGDFKVKASHDNDTFTIYVKEKTFSDSRIWAQLCAFNIPKRELEQWTKRELDIADLIVKRINTDPEAIRQETIQKVIGIVERLNVHNFSLLVRSGDNTDYIVKAHLLQDLEELKTRLKSKEE